MPLKLSCFFLPLYRAYPVDEIPARNRHAAAIIHMILNNLDPCVAQFPQELVTYGGNGQVFSNWAQVDTHLSKTKIEIYIFFSISKTKILVAYLDVETMSIH